MSRSGGDCRFSITRGIYAVTSEFYKALHNDKFCAILTVVEGKSVSISKLIAGVSEYDFVLTTQRIIVFLKRNAYSTKIFTILA